MEEAFDVVRFWDRRHQAVSQLRSGGHVSLTEADNHLFYQRRLALLLEILGDSGGIPRQIIDAGCGKGYFAGELAAMGHDVTALDPSPAAVAEARSRYPDVRFEVAAIADFRPLRLVDAVINVDVQFHIVDDDGWFQALRRMASWVRAGGLLIVSVRPDDERQELGDYIVHRSHADIKRLLAAQGLRFTRHMAYAFRESDLGFSIFRRVG